MSISNKTKRKLTCQFCDRKKDGCKCDKYWKTPYHKYRDEILKLYHLQLAEKQAKKT